MVAQPASWLANSVNSLLALKWTRSISCSQQQAIGRPNGCYQCPAVESRWHHCNVQPEQPAWVTWAQYGSGKKDPDNNNNNNSNRCCRDEINKFPVTKLPECSTRTFSIRASSFFALTLDKQHSILRFYLMLTCDETQHTDDQWWFTIKSSISISNARSLTCSNHRSVSPFLRILLVVVSHLWLLWEKEENQVGARNVFCVSYLAYIVSVQHRLLGC